MDPAKLQRFLKGYHTKNAKTMNTTSMTPEEAQKIKSRNLALSMRNKSLETENQELIKENEVLRAKNGEPSRQDEITQQFSGKTTNRNNDAAQKSSDLNKFCQENEDDTSACIAKLKEQGF